MVKLKHVKNLHITYLSDIYSHFDTEIKIFEWPVISSITES